MKRAAVLLVFILLFSLVPGFLSSSADHDASRQTRAGPTAVATFESLGLYWSPPDGSSTNTCNVRYRVNGTSAWSDGYPLWFDTRNGEYRGSLVQLATGTDYEIELKLQTTSTTAAFFASTWNETFPIAQTVIVSDQSTTLSITQSGTPDGYILYTHAKGQTATIDAANAQDYCVYVDASYVIIRDLVLKGAKIHGVYIEEGHNDVVIERCDISGWGRNDGSGWGEDLDSAVFAGKWAAYQPIKRIIIQRNTIHHPRSDSNNWDENHPNPPWNPYHPQGPQAVSFINTDGNHVIRYNHAYSDEDHYFNDIIGGGDNYNPKGSPNRDSDIYGNILENCWDDGIESEGGNRNVRIWGNYINNTYVKIACTPTEVGPLYVWRNIADRARRNHTFTDDTHGNFMKVASKVVDSEYWGDGRIYIFHNTVLQAPAEGGLAYPMGCSGGIIDSENKPYTMTQVVSRNNILQVHKPWWSSISEDPSNETNSFDYDLFNGDYNNSATPPAGIEDHGIKGTPTYDASNGDGEFYLAASTNGHDDGQVLKNFNDGYEGSAPDMGAHERGAPPMEFGPEAYLRPLEIITGDVTSVREDMPYLTDYDAVSDPSNTYMDWSLYTSAVFLSLDPDTGILSGTPDQADVGAHWVNVTVEDEWGREDWAYFFLTVLANDPPLAAIDVGEPRYGADPLFINSSTPVNLTAADPLDVVDIIWYSLDNGSTYHTYTGNLTVDAGVESILYGARDELGENGTAVRFNVSVDNEPPVTTLTGDAVDLADEFNLSASDDGCGVARIWLQIDSNGWTEYAGNFTLDAYGPHTIRYFAVDNLGQEEVQRQTEVNIEEPEPTQGSIFGTVSYLDGPKAGEAAAGAYVELFDTVLIDICMVNSSGYYEFPSVPFGGNYSIQVTPNETDQFMPDLQDGYLLCMIFVGALNTSGEYNATLKYQSLPPVRYTLYGIVTYKDGPYAGETVHSVVITLDTEDLIIKNTTTSAGKYWIYDVPSGTGYTLTATPPPDVGGEKGVRSGYLSFSMTIDITSDMTLDIELPYYTKPTYPTLTITSPRDGWIYEAGESFAIFGSSTDLEAGAVVEIYMDDQFETATVGYDGEWSAVLEAPDAAGDYGITVESGGASDGVFISVEKDFLESDQVSTSFFILLMVITLILIVIIAIVIVVLVMARRSKSPGYDYGPVGGIGAAGTVEEQGPDLPDEDPMGEPPDQSDMYSEIGEQRADEEAYGEPADEVDPLEAEELYAEKGSGEDAVLEEADDGYSDEEHDMFALDGPDEP